MSSRLSRDDESLDESLQSLARILFAGQTAEATLEAIAHLAQRAIPGCDAASVTVVEGGRPRTTVSTAEVAAVIDDRQCAGDAGPCLEAIRVGHVVKVDSFDDERRWPDLVPTILDQGVHSSLSLPLVAVDESVGALNLYSRGVGGFSGAEPIGEAFAIQAAITLANAIAFYRATELARNLTIALENRDVIGQAKGILMAEDGVSPEEAFDMLRRASQRGNRKLHDVAVEIVERRKAARA